MEDSAPEKWTYREHTRVKHILLEKYLAAWIPILGKWNRKICYVDGFAGRGEYSGSTLGSPLIVLRTADSLSPRFGKFICFLVEKDKDNFLSLERVLERERHNVQNWHKIEVHKRNDEFANVIEGILSHLKENDVFVPSFFFIDPFGFSGIPFAVIQEILSNPRTEVFFTFMLRDIRRFIGLPSIEGAFNELFGTDDWKTLMDCPGPEILLLDLYRKQLHECAGVKYGWSFRVCMTEKVQSLYYLIHATNSLKGHYVMKQIMINQSAQGNFAYLGPDDPSARIQMSLFKITETVDLKRYLSKRFERRVLTFDDVVEEVCNPWNLEPPYVEKHYRQALKELEEEHKVRIERVTSKTPRGLSGLDRIVF